MLRLLVSLALALATFVSCDFDPELHEKYLSMERDEFVEYFNSQNYSYTIKAYDFKPVYPVYGMMNASIQDCDCRGDPVITYNDSLLADLPDNFDAREKWPECVTIGEIYNQGQDCGSCWTFGTANTASDRTCIHKGLTVRLSEQDYNCLSKDVCSGGNSCKAFQYYIDVGLVTQECKPYDVEFLKKHECDKKCYNGADYAGDKHKGKKACRLDTAKEEEIKAELFYKGPIETMFNSYEDLHDYTGGVYEHKYGAFESLHSVRVIGYGVENDVPYWLVANSWGSNWGEKGFFKVKRYTDCLRFEIFLLTIEV